MKKLLILPLFILPLLTFVFSDVGFADHNVAHEAACEGAAIAGAECGSSGNVDDAVNNIAFQIIDIMSLVVGAVSVIMFIIGGFQFMTSTGDPGKTARARSTLIYAAVGLAIVLLAQSLVKYVINIVSGT